MVSALPALPPSEAGTFPVYWFIPVEVCREGEASERSGYVPAVWAEMNAGGADRNRTGTLYWGFVSWTVTEDWSRIGTDQPRGPVASINGRISGILAGLRPSQKGENGISFLQEKQPQSSENTAERGGRWGSGCLWAADFRCADVNTGLVYRNALRPTSTTTDWISTPRVHSGL